MLLKSELGRWAVEYGTGERLGKVRDVIVDTRRTNWPVTGLVITPGLGRGRHRLDVPTAELEVDPHARVLRRRGRTELIEEGPNASSLDHLHLSGLDGAAVYSQDDQPVGRAYDFVIATSPPSGWLVWRFLVNVPGARSRRLRLHVDDIASVERRRITLKATRDELRGSV